MKLLISYNTRLIIIISWIFMTIRISGHEKILSWSSVNVFAASKNENHKYWCKFFPKFLSYKLFFCFFFNMTPMKTRDVFSTSFFECWDNVQDPSSFVIVYRIFKYFAASLRIFPWSLPAIIWLTKSIIQSMTLKNMFWIV